MGNPSSFTFYVFPQCIFFVLDSYRQWWTKVACFCHCIQGALGKQDLGRLHHKPVKDRNGSTLIVAVNYVIVSRILVVVKLQHNWTFRDEGSRKMRYWPSELTDWRNKWMDEWTKEGRNKQMNMWMIYWLTDWLMELMNGWMNERMNKRASESTRHGSAVVRFRLNMQEVSH